jgi:hypothetical protein
MYLLVDVQKWVICGIVALAVNVLERTVNAGSAIFIVLRVFLELTRIVIELIRDCEEETVVIVLVILDVRKKNLTRPVITVLSQHVPLP